MVLGYEASFHRYRMLRTVNTLMETGLTPRWLLVFSACLLVVTVTDVALMVRTSDADEICFRGKTLSRGERGFDEAARGRRGLLAAMGGSAFFACVVCGLWAWRGLRGSSSTSRVAASKISAVRRADGSSEERDLPWKLRATMAIIGCHIVACTVFVVIMLLLGYEEKFDGKLIPLFMLFGWMPLAWLLYPYLRVHLK